MTYEREVFEICAINVSEAGRMTEKLNEILSNINTKTSYEDVKKQIEILFGNKLLPLIEKEVPFENIVSDIKISKHYTSTSYEFYIEDYIHLPVFELPDNEYWNVIKQLDEMTNSISKNEFWKIISQMDYASDLNYKRIKNDFVNEITPEFKETYDNLYSQLENRIDEMLQNEGIYNYENLIDLGDDSFGDMIAHIIGLGKDEYEKCMLNIQEVSAHAKGKFDTKEGYSKSFEYVFFD